MELVAVIVARKSLPRQAVANLCSELPAAQEAKWLAAGKACEIPFTGNAPGREARRALCQHVQAKLGFEADVGVFERENRRKKLLLADMDSTIIEQECLDELGAEAGCKDTVARITERAMRGEIGFEAALRERVLLLQKLPLTRLQAVIDRITFTPGAKTLVATMKAHGATAALVSSGFTQFTQYVADKAGFDFNFANRFEVSGDRLTGRVSDPLFGGPEKRVALLDLCRQGGLQPHDALAIGDGSNDLLMIRDAGLGLAYRAKPILAEAADTVIAHGDLTAALYFQGYAEHEFAPP